MWIRDWREAHGMELDDFARAVNRYGHERMKPRLTCYITDYLVHMIEVGAITHPRIANAIAEYCGATAEQRDMLVNEEHRGEWKPGQHEVRYVKKSASRFNNCQNGAKPVVKVDVNGEVIASYESLNAASRYERLCEDNIRDRCKRRARREMTADAPYTFRYQSEWLTMSMEERMRDIMPKGDAMATGV